MSSHGVLHFRSLWAFEDRILDPASLPKLSADILLMAALLVMTFGSNPTAQPNPFGEAVDINRMGPQRSLSTITHKSHKAPSPLLLLPVGIPFWKQKMKKKPFSFVIGSLRILFWKQNIKKNTR